MPNEFHPWDPNLLSAMNDAIAQQWTASPLLSAIPRGPAVPETSYGVVNHTFRLDVDTDTIRTASATLAKPILLRAKFRLSSEEFHDHELAVLYARQAGQAIGRAAEKVIAYGGGLPGKAIPVSGVTVLELDETTPGLWAEPGTREPPVRPDDWPGKLASLQADVAENFPWSQTLLLSNALWSKIVTEVPSSSSQVGIEPFRQRFGLSAVLRLPQRPFEEEKDKAAENNLPKAVLCAFDHSTCDLLTITPAHVRGAGFDDHGGARYVVEVRLYFRVKDSRAFRCIQLTS